MMRAAAAHVGLVSATIAMLVSGSCRGAPDYRVDGEGGDAPVLEGEPTYTETYQAKKWVYRPPLCERWHNITTTATQTGVDCQTYDYFGLYRHAMDTYEFRAKQFDCTNTAQECPHRQAWVNAEEWSCAAAEARMVIQGSVRCTTDPGEQQRMEPTRAELRTPGSKTYDATPREYVEGIDLTPIRQPQGCPTEVYYRVVLKEKVETCDAVTSMKPHVDEARARVQRLWRAVTCPGPCRKEPFRPDADERYKWTCGEDPDGDDDLVTVIAELRVRCVKQ